MTTTTAASPADAGTEEVPPPRTVIVDDTVDLRALLRLALARGGFDVVAEAGDGREGIEVVREVRPDVVLLDLSMPVMDGLEALPTIRRLLPRAKIVVLSGFGATQMSARAIAAGADGYVQKGSSLDAILDYVSDITGGTSLPKPVSATLGMPYDASRPPLESEPLDVSDPPNPRVSAWEAVSMAPFGVLELADEPLFRIVHANAPAQRLLGRQSAAGTPLGLASPDLASLVAFHRLDADATFEVRLDGGSARATVRRTGWSVLVYLDSAAEDVGVLRRAIATTAHEIRGPVAVICGIAETVGWSADAITEAQRDRLMSAVARQAKMLDSITADLLTAAQIQRGTLRVDLQEVDPRAAVESVVRDRHDIEVVVDDQRRVRADPLRLEQMLSNLLSNADKYGRAPFTVHLRPEDDHLCLDVIDRGDGVPPEFEGQLFREFARAHGTVATGTGLGLFVVRTLAEAQGGTVSHAPAPGGGAAFTVRLLAC